MKKRTKRGRRRPRARQVHGTYVNHVEFLPSSWELTAVFRSQSREYTPEGGEQWRSKEVARVTLPIGLAKVALFGLMAHITGYEVQFGRIDVPSNMIPNIPPAELIGSESVAKLAIAKAELFGRASTVAVHPDAPQAQAPHAESGPKILKVH